ncbi:hypothetical protein FDP41_003969 [Naegleria fowleri]|uniref:Uncharacterized protein n=1 Tax=Naegleria fowleri TaxID=5763 RepID=A0A6A5BQH8_NAEFO|nr:uncharacterized protein FDP41_003969 [Naegleria fowleri]KAF0977316.1 hypothetical protein FDP41_003969 [Naegleria fowleri]CAG4715417.1 unnamed protein product [Naegleria fowleri]
MSNNIPLLEASALPSDDSNNIQLVESSYYIQPVPQDLEIAEDTKSTLPDSTPTTRTILSKREKLKKYWMIFRRATFGNRRLKSYLLTVCKFFSITFLQANNLFELDKENTHPAFTKSIEIISYTFMAVLILSFTFRYVREVYCSWKKKPLNITLNWVEACIFFLYFIFSCMTAVTHLVYIGKSAYNETNPVTPTKIGMGIFGVLVNYYIILEKAWAYLKASKYSASMYLAKGTLIPNEKKTK